MIYERLSIFFKEVKIAKPKSSRNSSPEAFVVCKGFELPEGWGKRDLTVFDQYMEKQRYRSFGTAPTKEKWVPFVACGDLSAWDSDMNYILPQNHSYTSAIAPPINAPYSRRMNYN